MEAADQISSSSPESPVRLFRIPPESASTIFRRFHEVDSNNKYQLPPRPGMNTFYTVSTRRNPGQYLRWIIYFPEGNNLAGSIAALAFEKPKSKKSVMAALSDLEWDEEKRLYGSGVLGECIQKMEEESMLEETLVEIEDWETRRDELRKLAGVMGIQYLEEDWKKFMMEVKKLSEELSKTFASIQAEEPS